MGNVKNETFQNKLELSVSITSVQKLRYRDLLCLRHQHLQHISFKLGYRDLLCLRLQHLQHISFQQNFE
jgi:hypothetical protein